MASKTPTILVLIGAPGSGKSTFAEWKIKTEPKWMRVSRDEIRFSQFTEVMERDVEELISKMIYAQTKTLIENGWNVIMDACHTNYDFFYEIEKEYLHLAKIEYKIFNVSLEEILKRNQHRARKVPENIVKKMHAQLQELLEKANLEPKQKIQLKTPYKIPSGENKCVIVDLDGTLSLNLHRDIFTFTTEEILTDTVVEPVQWIVKKIENSDVKLVFCSGREDVHFKTTKQWLEEKVGVYNFDLHMRKTGDFRNDGVIKKEILDEKILPKYAPIFVIDDRKRVKKMWVKNDIFVLDVNQFDLEF